MVSPDKKSVRFVLRPEARFHDGTTVTADDVVFSFNTLLEKGHPSYKIIYRDVSKAEALSPNEVQFTFKDDSNNQLPLQIGEFPVFAKHSWQGKDFSASTLQPIIGSGPYKIATIDPGRRITYERVKDYWGAKLANNQGRNNYDLIHYDYYRDETVQIEAFLAGRYDLRQENTAKLWATAYNTTAVKNGTIIKQNLPNELPVGMQAFVLNQRRPQFQDARVREALDLAFDFEWGNKNTAFGAYKRTESYFDNTELAATGLPNADELKLLEPYRGKIPDEVFTQVYKEPTTDGSGNNRDNLRRASLLLEQAGWVLKNGVLINAKTETPFAFTLLEYSSRFERWVQPYFRNLERLGIKPTMRVVDAAQFQHLTNEFDYDVLITTFAHPLSPSLEQRNFWASANADVKGSNNLIGLKNPVVDALVEGIIAAKDRADLITHCRALDRVLLWNHYVIPQWHISTYRLAYWNKFGQPTTSPKYGLGFLDQWWVEAEEIKSLPKALQ
jgi:microcin C transport system substrate-binding protein